MCRSIGLPESVKQVWKILARNPRTRVFHRKAQMLVKQSRTHADAATRRRKLDSIPDEIGEHL
jgi:hypothetical protein